MAEGAAKTEHGSRHPKLDGLLPRWSPELQAQLPVILPAYFNRCRWFGGKGRTIEKIVVRAEFPDPQDETARLLLVEITFSNATKTLHALALKIGRDLRAADQSAALVAELPEGVELVDAISTASFRRRLLQVAADEESWRSEGAAMCGHARTTFGGEQSRLLTGEQSNSTFVFDDAIAMKFLRRLEPGPHPDAEILKALSEEGFRHTPGFMGEITFHLGDEKGTLALATSYVAGARDTWQEAQEEIDRYLRGGSRHIPDFAKKIWLLGRRTGELHAVLCHIPKPEFRPERFTRESWTELKVSLSEQARQSSSNLDRLRSGLDPDSRYLAEQWLEALPHLDRTLEEAFREVPEGLRMRIHGDYHLGQVLSAGDDFVILDFEGEPRRPLADRLSKRSPVVDVAGMLRSFDYVAALSGAKAGMSQWVEAMQQAFLRGYLSAVEGTAAAPPSKAEFDSLLRIFLLEKAIYEVGYETSYRPQLVSVPLRAVLNLLAALPGAHESSGAP